MKALSAAILPPPLLKKSINFVSLSEVKLCVVCTKYW